jgi:hypothetical protein
MLAVVALLVNPKLPESARMEGEGREAARSLGQQLLVLNASTPNEIDTEFATMRQRRVVTGTLPQVQQPLGHIT